MKIKENQIEAWGRGIEKMKRDCIADNLPEPEFKILATKFSISFTIHEAVEENAEKDTEAVEKKGTIKGTIKGTMKGTMKGTEKITESQKLILDSVAENPQITIDELVPIVGIAASKIKENISKLKSNGLIERVGARRSGYWKVKKKRG